MTRKVIQKKKQQLLKKRPTLDIDTLTYQLEMAEWDAQLTALELEEAKLVEQEEFEKLELLGQINNLERRRNNRLQSIELLKKQYKAIGMRINRASNYKKRQWNICLQIVEMEAEVQQFG